MLSQPTAPTAAAPAGARSLIGAWRLISWEARAPDGTITHPFGQDALGSIIYSADGQMAAQLTRQNRSPFAGDDMLRGTDMESATALRSYIAYACTYRFEGNTVIHQVQLSLFPNWVDSEQRREIAWDGDHLVLSTQPIAAAGPAAVHRLVWERAQPAR